MFTLLCHVTLRWQYKQRKIEKAPNPQFSAYTHSLTHTQIHTESLKTHPGKRARNSLKECLHILVSNQVTRDNQKWRMELPEVVWAVRLHLQFTSSIMLQCSCFTSNLHDETHHTRRLLEEHERPHSHVETYLDTCNTTVMGVQLPQISIVNYHFTAVVFVLCTRTECKHNICSFKSPA